MARVARIVAVGEAHHITQRGNNRQIVFSDDNDRLKYLDLIKTHSKNYCLEILAYCLMTNHVHFIVIPNKEDSLAKTFNFAHMRYSQYYNKKHGRSGHLWQGRFYSCVMDEVHTNICVRYIERNPVRAKMVGAAWNYIWSSARVHCGIEINDKLEVWKLFRYIDSNKKNWRKYLEIFDNEMEIKEIKKHTMRGSVFGKQDFIKKLEKKLNRSLLIRPRGRPWP